MIETQLVSFDVARMAKEAGFFANTRFSYADNGELDSAFDYIGFPLFSKEDYENAEENGFGNIPAPTQELLAKWLREKKDIIAQAVYISEYNYFQALVVATQPNVEMESVKGATYEDAFEAALVNALNYLLDEQQTEKSNTGTDSK